MVISIYAYVSILNRTHVIYGSIARARVRVDRDIAVVAQVSFVLKCDAALYARANTTRIYVRSNTRTSF